MTIIIGVVLVVLIGLVIFGLNMNKKRSVNKDDAMKSGGDVRRDPNK